MGKAEEIVNRYYERAGYKKVLPGFKKRSIEYIQVLLDSGMTQKTIEDAIENYFDNLEEDFKPHSGIDRAINLLPYGTRRSDDLLENGKFYYHKRLRLTPPPPKITVNDKGEVTRVAEPFYLEMADCFTANDMLDYFYEVHNVPVRFRNEKRDMGAINYIIEQYNGTSDNWIDHILFMIDVSRDIIICNDLKPVANVLKIIDYDEDALNVLNDKIDYARINGLDKVVPKRCGLLK